MQRKKAPVSIFAPKKRPVNAKRPPPPAQQAQAKPPSAPNGTTTQAAEVANQDDAGWTEYPIFVSKDTLMQGLHYHAMKLQPKQNANGEMVAVDPWDEDQFPRPVHLHRRSARDKMAEQAEAAEGVDDKERELLSIKREERQREKAANQAQIAPTGDSAKATKQKPKKKVEDVYYNENNPKQARRSKLRYEEARPWHLEDFDGKNVWVGAYEEPPSEESVMFEIGNDGFRMVPVEKWYRFAQTNKINAMDSEDVEKQFAKKVKMPRWYRKTPGAKEEARVMETMRRKAAVMANQRGGDEDEFQSQVNREEYNADVDEIDFGFEDEFQNDDEGFLFGDPNDEDAKETEQRVREEMREAGLGATGIKDEDKDWDAEEEKKRNEEAEEKRKTKKLRRQLMKKERKMEYDSESEHGEFSDVSESEDSGDERERLEQEEKKKQEEAQKLQNGDKSGASTKGTNTPTGRVEKKDPTRLGNSLKRPGSPDLSEVSGNESSRKKVKVNGAHAPNGALAPPRTGTGNSGSGSETEASRREGRARIRIKNSPPGSPNGSRTGTPSGSRAQSPQRKGPPSFPTMEEIRAAIPKGGITIGELIKPFRASIQGAGPQAQFIQLVKSAGKQDPLTKKIMPKVEDGA